MSRIQFPLPGHFVFSTAIQIYISHVNQGGHLDNAQLLTLVSEARVRFFKSLGYTEGNVEGHPIVVGDMDLNSRSWTIADDSIENRPIQLNALKYHFILMLLS